MVLRAGAPVFAYGTYFGGSGDDGVVSMSHTSSGELIVAGVTTSSTLPGTVNAFQKTKAVGFPGTRDVFVAKFDSTGRKLLWTTFLGGDSDDAPTAITTDASGNIFVVGTTNSSNFPARTYITCSSGSTALQQKCSSAQSMSLSGFAVKLSADGSRLIYSVGFDVRPSAVAVDAQGSAYIGAATFNGLYMLHLDTGGTRMLFGTFLGGGGFNASETSIALVELDEAGNSWIAGAVATGGVGLPTTANALQAQQSNAGFANSIGPGALSNGFVIQLDSSGTRALYGTYLGPRYSGTSITGFVLSADGSVYVAGSTNADSFQATPGAYLSAPTRGFVARLRPGASSLDAFSYLPVGASRMKLGRDQSLHLILPTPFKKGVAEYLALQVPALSFRGAAPLFAASDLDVSSAGTIWLAGSAYATSNFGGLFVTTDAFQPSLNGPSDAFLGLVSWIDPAISLVANSAAGSGTFAPGQLISIYGSQLGPFGGTGAQIGAGGVVSSSAGGTEVLFDGVAAPVLYAGSNQVNTIIPCSTTGKSSTQMIVQYLGAQSAAFSLLLGTAAPGIFTVDGTGKGQAAALNSDFSLNGPANPAPRGSVVVFYATGIGATSPCVDGQTYQSSFPKPTLPMVVGVGGAGVPVLYAGQAPFLVSGVAQINISIPSDSPTGSVPLTLLVGDALSPSGVTIAVN